MKCEIGDCGIEPTFYFARIESRRLMFEKFMCEGHAHTFFTEFRSSVVMGAGAQSIMPSEVCVDLEMIVFHNAPEEKPAGVYLHEVNGERRFCTMVDSFAYSALMAEIKQHVAPRPLTHAGWGETIKELGGELQDVVIDKLSDVDKWFDTRLRIVKDGRLVTVDVRPSDAYILAVTCAVPIFVVEKALERFADADPNPIKGIP